MRKSAVKSITELKDSRILFEKDLPPYGYLLVVIVTLVAIAVIVWSTLTAKTSVIKTQGLVESTNKQYIMTSYSGEIKQFNIFEGCFVEDGDVLFTIKNADLDLQYEQLAGQIAVYTENVAQLRKLEASIMEGENRFDLSKPGERQYYNQYEAYMSQIKQNDVDTSMYKSYGYSDVQIEAELKKSSAKVSELYYSTLANINERITQYENEIDKLVIQKDAVTKGSNEYQVIAHTSGIVHLTTEYKAGMVVQAGNAIGSISNENDEYQITAYINLNDRPRVSAGDEANIEVVGLAQNTYGTLSGKLISIDNDISTSQDGQQSFFKAKISIDTPYLISNNGNKVNIYTGMAVEARIIYDELSYFDYFLESLGLLTRD